MRHGARAGRAAALGRWLPALVALVAQQATAATPRKDTWAGAGADQLTGRCLVCHGAQGFAVTSEDGSVLSMTVDLSRLRASVHGDLACTSCHWDFSRDPHTDPLAKPPKELVPFVQVLAPLATSSPASDAGAAAGTDLVRPCSQCRAALASCGACHEQEFRQYWGSVHGQGVLKGDAGSPTCTTCHGTHYMVSHEDLESSTSHANVPATCGSCHADATLMAQYDLRIDTYRTYEESFHGKKTALGSKRAAVCTSCHGVHDICAPEDPNCRLHGENRVATCGQCHKGASPQFALSFGHTARTRTEAPWAYWIGRIYWIFIWSTLAALIGFIVLERIHVVFQLIRRRLGL